MGIMIECPLCHTKQSVKNKICRCGFDIDKAKKGKKVRYWISYYIGKKQKREAVTGQDVNPYSIEDARLFLSKRKIQKKEKRIFDIKAESTMTFSELTDWYLSLEDVKALASYWLIELSLKKFNSVFGDRVISDVRKSDLENYQAMRKKEGKAAATIDHEIGKTKTMIRKAFDDGRITGEIMRTFGKVKKTLKPGAGVRNRVLTKEEYQRLYEAAATYMKPIIATAYYTGMRRGEILPLTWDRVDLKGRVIHLMAEDTKDREARDVPICNELYTILEKIPRALHSKRVFRYRGKPVNDIRGGLRAACKKAGIAYGRFLEGGFVFHDLRHTFVTNMRKAGVAESVIMCITGHSTRTMFDRYNSIDSEDTRNAVDILEGFLKDNDQTNDQVEEGGK